MGCWDKDSNFNAFIYTNGKWMVGWGYELSFEAPTKEILEEELSKWRGVWSVQTTPKGNLIAKAAELEDIKKTVIVYQD